MIIKKIYQIIPSTDEVLNFDNYSVYKFLLNIFTVRISNVFDILCENKNIFITDYYSKFKTFIMLNKKGFSYEIRKTFFDKFLSESISILDKNNFYYDEINIIDNKGDKKNMCFYYINDEIIEILYNKENYLYNKIKLAEYESIFEDFQQEYRIEKNRKRVLF